MPIRIYLDWNIYSNLMSVDRLTDNFEKQMYESLKEIFVLGREKIITPYSNAHLNDLMKSYKQGERERVESALAFISILTQNVCIAQYWDEENAKWHYRDPNDFFNSLIKDDEENPFESFGDVLDTLDELGVASVFKNFKAIPHGIDFTEINKTNPMFAGLFSASQRDGSVFALMCDVFDMFNQIQTNPNVYIEFRKLFKNNLGISTNISNFDNTIEQLDAYFPKTMLNKSFTELFQEHNKDKSSKNKDYSKITGLYMQLDFVGFNSDKINEKNKYQNLFNDALHCFYGAHCDFYITSDKRGYKKSKAVYQSEGILTQVLKPQEFIDFIMAENGK